MARSAQTTAALSGWRSADAVISCASSWTLLFLRVPEAEVEPILQSPVKSQPRTANRDSLLSGRLVVSDLGAYSLHRPQHGLVSFQRGRQLAKRFLRSAPIVKRPIQH